MPTADAPGQDPPGPGPGHDAAGHDPASARSSAAHRGLVPDTVAALVAIRAAGNLRRPREIQATGMLARPGSGMPRQDRQRLVAAATAGGRAWIDGEMVDEDLGSRRWLAWFPRPTGPRHAVNVPSPVVEVLADQVPGVRLVRCHLAARAWQAEGLQALATLTQLDAGRRWAQRWAERGADEPDPTARWAVVVEVLGDDEGGDGARLVRGWAHGTGRSATAAALAHSLADGWPSDPDRAAGLLDAVAMTPGLDLRWSVGDPTTIAR